MYKIEIQNAHTNESKILAEVVFEKRRINNYIELEDGTFLRDMNDGRYYEGDGYSKPWARMMAQKYDADGELVIGKLLGYVRV